jgi:hypothetical protein
MTGRQDDRQRILDEYMIDIVHFQAIFPTGFPRTKDFFFSGRGNIWAEFYPWWLFSTLGGYILPVVAIFYPWWLFSTRCGYILSRATRDSGMGQGIDCAFWNKIKQCERFRNILQLRVINLIYSCRMKTLFSSLST